MTDTNTTRHWYQEPYVWMLILIPLMSVVGGIAMIYLAVQTNDGLVVDDYYRHGKEINRVLARDRAAAELGLAGELRYQAASGVLSLKLHAGSMTAMPERIRARFLHATRQGLDQTIHLGRIPDGRYHGLIKPLPPGHWYVQLDSGRWRLLARFKTPGAALIRLHPRPALIKP